MLNVLNTQLFRLKKSKLFWALFIVCAALPLLGMVLSASVMAGLGDLIEDGGGAALLEILRGEGGYITLQVLGNLTAFGSDPALFSLITSSIFLSGEFTSGAIRNMVLANKSRTQIFLSFLSVALIIGFSYYGVSYAVSILSYGLLAGFEGIAVADAVTGCVVSFLLGLLTIAFVQAIVCFFLFITRKTGGTIAFPLLVVILLPSLVTTFVKIVEGIKVAFGQSLSAAALGWIPLHNLSMYNATAVDGALVGKIILYNGLLAALFSFFGWLALDKCDLK